MANRDLRETVLTQYSDGAIRCRATQDDLREDLASTGRRHDMKIGFKLLPACLMSLAVIVVTPLAAQAASASANPGVLVAQKVFASANTHAAYNFQVRPGNSAAPFISGSNHSLNSDSCPDATF